MIEKWKRWTNDAKPYESIVTEVMVSVNAENGKVVEDPPAEGEDEDEAGEGGKVNTPQKGRKRVPKVRKVQDMEYQRLKASARFGETEAVQIPSVLVPFMSDWVNDVPVTVLE